MGQQFLQILGNYLARKHLVSVTKINKFFKKDYSEDYQSNRRVQRTNCQYLKDDIYRGKIGRISRWQVGFK
jgi:hypothetical protein